MAKIRIYELARNLNMENKALLEKLEEMGIAVKSHMSALEDETVEEIKLNFQGKKAEAIEENRVKPTVIRRRRKRVEEKAVQAEAASEPEVQPDKPEAEAVPPEEELDAQGKETF